MQKSLGGIVVYGQEWLNISAVTSISTATKVRNAGMGSIVPLTMQQL